MGTPINQQETQTAHDILRELVCRPVHTVRQEALRATGIDVDMLETTYETNLRPFLDYLHGYEALEALDPLRGQRWEYSGNHLVPVATPVWTDLLENFSLRDRHPQVQKVALGPMYAEQDWQGPRAIVVAFYLTRNGKWLFWYAEGDLAYNSQYVNEHISQHETVRKMWEYAHKLIPDTFTFARHFGGAKNPPLAIKNGLQRILKETIDQRQRRLDSMKESCASMERRNAIVFE